VADSAYRSGREKLFFPFSPFPSFARNFQSLASLSVDVERKENFSRGLGAP
jgi:hypothetical protein